METVRQFMAMGGYGTFVWSSYAVAVVVMVGLVLASRRSLRRQQRLLRQVEENLPQPHRRHRRTGSRVADDA
jgi:heme exporter protein D